MDKETTGALIAKLRKNKGMTQSALAEILGISNKTVSKWECDDGLPDVSILCDLAEVLGCTVDELLAGKLKEEKRLRVEEVANSKNVKNIFDIFTVISIFLCAFGGILGAVNSIYSYSHFNILFYTHWEIIFDAVSFAAIVLANLIFYSAMVRLNIVYSKMEIFEFSYKRALWLWAFSSMFIIAFLIRILKVDVYITATLVGTLVWVLTIVIPFIIIKKKIKNEKEQNN